MKRIVLASKNDGKLKEFEEFFSDLNINIVSIKNFDDVPEVVEDGNSFEENAIKKATAVYNFIKEPVIADDSGLEVDFLGGKPGIYSARFAGEMATDEENNNKLLKLLKGVNLKQRTARFVSVIALVWDDGKVYTTKGSCEGYIGYETRGSGGFGYDPLFVVPEYNKTFAELPLALKNRISHRARALKKMKETIKNLINSSD